MDKKRLILSMFLGAISGIFCIIGVNQRIPVEGALPSNAIFLAGAYYNRLILGLLIGLAGEIQFSTKLSPMLNSVIRGIVLGIFVSLGFALFHQFSQPTFIGAGAMFGGIMDLLATKMAEKRENE